MKIRVKFRKYGPVRFIGHLDVMRYFQKALRRAEIDVKYTSGFSPHQIMSFASPLGVGLESNGEYMDIECSSATGSQNMMERLNRTGAPGIEVISVKRLPDNAGNAMASVAAAEYTVRFREGRQPAFDFVSATDTFLAREHIFVARETKKGTQDVDIRPGIYQMKTCFEPDGSLAVRLLLDASSAGNVRPGRVMEAFCGTFGASLEENALSITREEIYTDIGEKGEHKFIPLDDIGTEFFPEGNAAPEEKA